MFTKLNHADLARYRATASYPEYAEFLATLGPGDGGRVGVADAGVGRQTVKNRLRIASEASGLALKFVRSRPDEVVFTVVDEPRRGRRPRK